MRAHFSDFHMVRRTKAEAEQTRHAVIDAAERLFHAKGVALTSLADIAAEAGVTRGAVYWHFKDKADIFNAMMDRVTLPLETLVDEAVNQASDKGHALAALRNVTFACFTRLQQDPQMQRVFDITRNRVAYVADMLAVQQRLARTRDAFLALTARAIAREAQQQKCSLPIALEQAAIIMHAQIDGLVHHWLMTPGNLDLPSTASLAFENVARGLGLKTEQWPAPAA